MLHCVLQGEVLFSPIYIYSILRTVSCLYSGEYMCVMTIFIEIFVETPLSHITYTEQNYYLQKQ